VSIYIHKSHNVSVLLYHLVIVAKYRNVILDKRADTCLTEICLELAKRYELCFLEIGADLNHVHFLIQSVPTYAPDKIARIVKSLTARELKTRIPEIKQKLWGAEVWTAGYFISTVGRAGAENVIQNYIKNQGNPTKNKYTRIHKAQLGLL
jgi:putative transposase